MTFSYTDPSASKKDAVRFLVQDTDVDQPLLQDEEIEWLISMWGGKGSSYYVASRACESIAMKFAREVTFSSDSQSISLGELMAKYKDMAADHMATDNSMGVGELFVGGAEGIDSRGPSFAIGMHDDPGAGPQYQYGFDPYNAMQWGTSIP